MTKTPEQMAEEYAKDWWGNLPEAESMRKSARENFLAGYKAGQEHPFQFQTKMWVDPIGPQNQWISVKERLPVFRQYNQNDESGYTEDVLMCFVWGRIRINNFEKVDGIVTTGYGNNLNEVTHWMPLPAPPKEEK